jgi:hypothetical protein
MADEFDAIDTRSAILGVISELVAGRQPAQAGRLAVDKSRRAGQRG